jgi:beta-lactamase class A
MQLKLIILFKWVCMLMEWSISGRENWDTHITFTDDDAVKKVGVCSNSKSKAQNILYVKCDAKR